MATVCNACHKAPVEVWDKPEIGDHWQANGWCKRCYDIWMKAINRG